jgi:hypothetical protein
MSKVEILNAINPQISLTIGNAEIVNMLVQARVAKLNETKAANDQRLVTSSLEMAAIHAEFRTQIKADYVATFGKKLESFAKVYKDLTGTKVTSTFGEGIEGCESWAADGLFIGFVDSQYNRRSPIWTDADKLPKEIPFEVNFVQTPTSKEVTAKMKSSGLEEEAALQACLEDACLFLEFELKLPLTAELKAVILKARELNNRRNAIAAENRELNRLLADTPAVEREILAKMTQNTLQSNPELAQAFGVLAGGLMQLDAAGLPALSVD